MENDIARVVEELFVAAGLGGFIVPYENADTRRWTVWYALTEAVSRPYVKYGRLILLVTQLDARVHDESASEDARVIGAEICVEGSGACVLDLGFVEPTVENARIAAERLLAWVAENVRGVQVT